MADRQGLPVWVYGVLDGDVTGPPSCRGVDPAHEVELIRHAGLAAAASPVGLEDYGERGLRASLEDLERLEALARAHEQVLDEALRGGAVVPFRICTVYASAEGVREMLAREQTRLTATLQRLRGMAEWGVKAYAMVRAGDRAAAAAASSGTDYLSRKRAGRDAAETARQLGEAAAEAVHARLRERTADAVLRPPQDRRLSGHQGRMTLNAAYLVAVSETADFHALVEELAGLHRAQGLELELTGPWPAYNFSEAVAG
jgi:hypothetical protein